MLIPEKSTASLDLPVADARANPPPAKAIPISSLGYVVVGLWLFLFILARVTPMVILGLLALALLLLRSNPRRLRQRIPGFRSPNRLVAVASWVGLVAGGLVLTLVAIALTPATTGKPDAGVSTSATAVLPAPVAALEPAATPIPPTALTSAPVTESPTTMPIPNATAWLARVDAGWQSGDWPAELPGLDALQALDPAAVDFTDKRYIAQYSWGKTLLDNGDKIGAATHFGLADQIDPAAMKLTRSYSH